MLSSTRSAQILLRLQRHQLRQAPPTPHCLTLFHHEQLCRQLSTSKKPQAQKPQAQKPHAQKRPSSSKQQHTNTGKPPQSASTTNESTTDRLRAYWLRRRPSPSRRPTTSSPNITIHKYILPDAGLTPSQLSALSLGVSGDASVHVSTVQSILTHAQSLDPAVIDASSTMPSALVDLITDELPLPLKFTPQTMNLLFAPPSVTQKRKSKTKISKTRTKRMPVVTVMGHVDHGKTSLLDAIRISNVATTEEGGITQSVAAFCVPVQDSYATFIDTPGHAAFSAMRSNGTVATDVVILVVAADDGVMPQTEECIRLAREANVPIVVALNKCDLPGVDTDKIRAQLLSKCGVECEQIGGTVQCVEVSAKLGNGLSELLDAVLLEAGDVATDDDDGELVDETGRMVCLESRVDRFMGSVATVVVKQGMIKRGDFIVMQCVQRVGDRSEGELYGRAKMIVNTEGKDVEQAGVGEAVGVVGLGLGAKPGCVLWVAETEKEAKLKAREIDGRNNGAKSTIQTANHILAERSNKERRTRHDDAVMTGSNYRSTNVSSGSMVERNDNEDADGYDKEINVEEKKKWVQVVVKGDVRGSADAVAQCMKRLEDDEIGVRIVHIGVGDVTDADVTLSTATNLLNQKSKNSKKKRQQKNEEKNKEDEKWVLAAFGVRVRESMRKAAGSANVHVIQNGIIYQLEDEVRKLMDGMRDNLTNVKVVGVAGVVKVFEKGVIGGCLIKDGALAQGAKVRVMRKSKVRGMDEVELEDEGQVVYEGIVETIKQFSKDVRIVQKGFECGIRLTDWDAFEDGDEIQALD